MQTIARRLGKLAYLARPLALTFVGVTMLSIGVAFFFIALYRWVDAPEFLRSLIYMLTLQPLDRWLRGLTDSVELALKTALLATGKRGIIAFEGGYHGGVLYFRKGGAPLNLPIPTVTAAPTISVANSNNNSNSNSSAGNSPALSTFKSRAITASASKAAAAASRVAWLQV